MVIEIVLVVLLALTALVTVMMARLLWAAVMLALTSAVVAIIMFRLDSPIAAVFELSVCAGLIPAIFISAISLTGRLTAEGVTARWVEKIRRFWYLPVIVIILAVALTQAYLPFDFTPPAAEALTANVRTTLWQTRHLDLLGQIVILLAGAFGVVILVRER